MLNSKLKLVLLAVIFFLSLQIYSQNQKEEMAYIKGGILYSSLWSRFCLG